jgi:protein SCO1/2
MRSLAVPLVAAAVLSALLVLGVVLAKRRANEPPVLFAAPEWSFPDQAGRTTTSGALAGKPYVADFVFTQCRTVCPMLTARMVQLQRDLGGVDVRFVSFSVDPGHDTPEKLAAYAHEWAPTERRWTLLSTTEDGLSRLVGGFHVLREKTNDPNDPIVHTAMFFLVDDKGQVRGTFDSEHGEELASLEQAVRSLAGAPAPSHEAPAALPKTGDALYHALSCANCHERTDFAPPLTDIRDRRRELETGVTVVADESYVRESIVQPDAKRVRGYPLRMPAYDGLLDEARLKTLVEWVLARRSEKPTAADESATLERDPVCNMNVRVTADAIKTDVGGHTTYFCSEYCRDRFLANPSAYAHQDAAAPGR